MGSRRAGIRHSKVILVAAVCALALPATSAAKSPKVSNAFAVGVASGNGAIATATATCPKGRRATGGGFQAPIPTVDVLGVVYESQKVGQRGWKVSAQLIDNGAPTAFTVRVIAHCARRVARTKTDTVSFQVAAQNTIGGEANPGCNGEGLRAGGFQTDPPVVGNSAKSLVYSSVGLGGQWFTHTIATTTGPHTLTGFAYCEKKAKGRNAPKLRALKEASASAAPVSTSTPTSTSTIAVSCPRKKVPLAGGFDQDPSPGVTFSYFIPYQSMRVGKTWVVSGLHTGNAPTTLTSRALCG